MLDGHPSSVSPGEDVAGVISVGRGRLISAEGRSKSDAGGEGDAKARRARNAADVDWTRLGGEKGSMPGACDECQLYIYQYMRRRNILQVSVLIASEGSAPMPLRMAEVRS